MKKILYRLLVAVNLFFAAGTVLKASHLQGGEITYTCVGPNSYQVTYKGFTDCAGGGPSVTYMLALKAPGCNMGRNITLSNTGLSKIGDPYCPAIGNLCNSSRINHQEPSYSGIVTFTAAEAACPDWIFSVTESARAAVANLQNPVAGNLYVEAYLNLRPGINNKSAVINPTGPTVELVCGGSETRLSLQAYDPDCDSLSYELVAPLDAAGVPISYASILAATSTFFTNPNPPAPYCNTCMPPNPQIANLVNKPAAYSATYPFPSFTANWQALNPVTGIPYQFLTANPSFNLDPATGELIFQAPPYVIPTTPGLGQNRYQVVVKITEWRKRNGVMTMVGNIRRDMFFILQDCGLNQNPSVATVTANGKQIQSNEIIIVRPGAPLNLQVTTTDHAGDILSLDSDATTMLPGATFTQTSANFPTGTVNWIAPATNGACGVRYFYVRVRDNACPIRGKKVYVIGVRVSNAGIATGLKEDRNANPRFTAYPNPFFETINFRFEAEQVIGKQEIEVYNGLGQQIDKLVVPAGKVDTEWPNAAKFPAGTYLARLITAGKPAQTLKFMKLQ